MRRNPRPPYALAPLLIVLVGTCYWLMTSGLAKAGLAFGWHGDRPADRMAMTAAITAGVAAQNAGDVHGSADEFQDAVTADGGNSRAYADVAQELIGRDLALAAAKLLESAVKQPDLKWDPMLWRTLADAYTHAGDPVRANDATERAREAAGVLENAEATKPASGNDARALAVRLRELGRYYQDGRDANPTRAIAALRAALALAPDDPKTQSALGYTLTELGTSPKELKDAVDLTQKAVQQETDDNIGPDSDLLDAYGWALFRSGDQVGARRVLSTGLDADPDSAILHFHIAKVYLAANDVFDAALELDRAILLEPGFPDANAARKALPSPLPTPLPVTPASPSTPTPAASPSPALAPGATASAAPAVGSPAVDSSPAPVVGKSVSSPIASGPAIMTVAPASASPTPAKPTPVVPQPIKRPL